MKIIINGGTGFIGTHLTNHYLQAGHDVIILTRTEKTTEEKSLTYLNPLKNTDSLNRKLEDADVLINLAGKSINDRWTKKSKNEIRESRIHATRLVYSIISTLQSKPKVVINASAIGIYGTSLHKTYTEASTDIGEDFLATTVKVWEDEAFKINDLRVRTVFARFGIVLGKEGALPKMVLPFKWFVGGRLGTGEQWVSWIHIEDLVNLIEFIIHTPSLSGPINFTAPEPVTMKEFGQTIAHILHKPYLLPAPSFLLKMGLGEMSLLILEGQRVLPDKALASGFQYSYPTIKSALTNLLDTK